MGARSVSRFTRHWVGQNELRRVECEPRPSRTDLARRIGDPANRVPSQGGMDPQLVLAASGRR